MRYYINRDDAIEKINTALKRVFVEDVGQAILETIPPADVAPVRHGRWDADMGGVWCSVCGEYSEGEWDYCPYCGAKMDYEEWLANKDR